MPALDLVLEHRIAVNKADQDRKNVRIGMSAPFFFPGTPE